LSHIFEILVLNPLYIAKSGKFLVRIETGVSSIAKSFGSVIYGNDKTLSWRAGAARRFKDVKERRWIWLNGRRCRPSRGPEVSRPGTSYAPYEVTHLPKAWRTDGRTTPLYASMDLSGSLPLRCGAVACLVESYAMGKPIMRRS